ncbi:efflux RND transporter periplasmic adaptor subunit [Flavitalea antarctica]
MRTPIILSLILVLAAACSNDNPQPPAQPPVAEVITISSSPATTGHDYTAAIQGKVDVEIRPQVDGFLDKVLVDEGAFVKAGQLLFKINDQPYREQLNNAVANLKSAEAQLNNAAIEIEKLTPLVENKIISDYQLKVAKSAHSGAAANVEQAKALVASAKIKLGYTNVTAPVSGYIGRLPKKQGSLVSPADPEALTNLSDVHEVYAYFSLGETDFINFKSQHEGASISDKLKHLPAVSLILPDNSVYPVTGKIDMVDGRFDKTTGAITLRAIFPNPNNLLRSGNTGKIRLQQQHPDAILVPQSATVEVQDKIFVYAVGDSNKVSKQPLQITGKSGTDYIVKDGVKAGDRIVINGLENLSEDLVIKPESPKINTQLSMAAKKN